MLSKVVIYKHMLLDKTFFNLQIRKWSALLEIMPLT